MKKVFYRIKYETDTGLLIEQPVSDLNAAKYQFMHIKNTLKCSNVKLFIVNEIEEELSIEQLSN